MALSGSTLFARAGRMLEGVEFISALSVRLEVDRRTVERWVSGAMYPPRGVWLELWLALRERLQEVERVQAEVERIASGIMLEERRETD